MSTKALAGIVFPRFCRLYFEGTTWPVEEWTPVFAERLLRLAASGIVWAQGERTFTLEDKGPVDMQGRIVHLRSHTDIRMAHVLDSEPWDQVGWAEYLKRKGQPSWMHQTEEYAIPREMLDPAVYKGLQFSFLSGEKPDGDFMRQQLYHTNAICTSQKSGGLHSIVKVQLDSFDRYTNHALYLLDRALPVHPRVERDDVGVIPFLDQMLPEKREEYLALAIRSGATRLTAALLEQQNQGKKHTEGVPRL